MDTVEVVFYKGEFHRRPTGKRGKKIPAALFQEYVDARTKYLDLRRGLELYFSPLKDLPMFVAKNVREGEVHRFNEDGSVTIS